MAGRTVADRHAGWQVSRHFGAADLPSKRDGPKARLRPFGKPQHRGCHPGNAPPWKRLPTAGVTGADFPLHFPKLPETPLRMPWPDVFCCNPCVLQGESRASQASVRRRTGTAGGNFRRRRRMATFRTATEQPLAAGMAVVDVRSVFPLPFRRNATSIRAAGPSQKRHPCRNGGTACFGRARSA
jgi:hypothetical protein